MLGSRDPAEQSSRAPACLMCVALQRLLYSQRAATWLHDCMGLATAPGACVMPCAWQASRQARMSWCKQASKQACIRAELFTPCSMWAATAAAGMQHTRCSSHQARLHSYALTPSAVLSPPLGNAAGASVPSNLPIVCSLFLRCVFFLCAPAKRQASSQQQTHYAAAGSTHVHYPP